ncbi:fumarylacetoacetate hydrolase family protein [Pyrofollis japonicus]|uniref:fumarylacetoacetate hydrolase family protein n=1 Tax=Pyrofollis japonicus TaxID=3060460 RepID=UPI00295BE1E6|nr:fumarylacetoacetate hydrolase family protein [Pyrofollis japonicus]BEP17434.1 fumarylacetoacetate hydrolase family protein [Pyrofollis japonicus]
MKLADLRLLLGYEVWSFIGLTRIAAPGGGVEPALVYRGRVYPLSAWGFNDVKEVMLEYPPEDIEHLARMVSSSDKGLPLGGVRFLAPIERPSKIIAVGLNYRAHAAETGRNPPPVPDLFVKTVNTVIGPGDPIILHDPGLRVDAEAELAVVIGLPGRSLEPEEVIENIWGYMAFNDVSARYEQHLVGASQWWRGKSRDTYAPMGPVIVPRTLISPWKGVDVILRVSGEELQHGNTSDMIHDVKMLVSYASRGTFLEPGDIIATGTPPGVGFARNPPRHLQPGDIVEVCIGKIGCIVNPVVPEKPIRESKEERDKSV